MCQRQGLDIRPLHTNDDLESILAETQPVALAWDLSTAQPDDWVLIRRLRHYPRLVQTPFILYGQSSQKDTENPSQTVGLTSFVIKSANEKTLLDTINALCPVQASGFILIVDDDPQARANHIAMVEKGLPGYHICTAENGEAALSAMAEEVPVFVLLDMMMPDLSGADVLDRMREDPRLRQVPVVILSNKALSQEDVKRLERHTHITFQRKGLLTESETIASLNRVMLGTDTLPPQTSALVKRAVSYLHQNYAHSFSRWEIASAIGVSEDYLCRVFSRELGLTPWDYLNRYRILQAKVLLLNTTENIGNIARQVGFKDQAYFSRVFHKLTGFSPQAFREHSEEV
jgi:AraC-like DNA-binding protein/DNA-binding response OmpR family regulator